MGDNFYVWRYMLVIVLFLVIFLFFGMIRMFESFCWFVFKGRKEDVLCVLKKIRDEKWVVFEL